MGKRSLHITEAELRIMKLLWQQGASTVRQVLEALPVAGEDRPAYTTVMTMMNVLERKGHLRKRTGGRSFLYRPTRSRQQVVGSMVREFVKRVFGGSAQPLLVHLVDEHDLSPEVLDALARRIQEKR